MKYFKHGIILFVVIVLGVGLIAEDKFVEPPKTIVNDQVPQIPLEIKSKMGQYSAIKDAKFVDWNYASGGIIMTIKKGNTNQLYAVNKPLGEMKQITDFEEPVSTAYFLPDKDKNSLIFQKDKGGNERYQFHLLNMANGKSNVITDQKSRHMGLLLNKKGDKIAYVNNSRNGFNFDIYVSSPNQPTKRKLVHKMSRPAYLSPQAWLKEDKELLFAEMVSINEVNTYILDIETGKKKLIKPFKDEKVFFGLSSPTPDGKKILGVSDFSGDFKRLILYDIDSDKAEVVTKDINWDVASITVDFDTKTAAFTVNAGGLYELYIMDTETFSYKKVENIPVGVISDIKFLKGTGRLSMSITGPRVNGDVFEYNTKTGKLIRWTESDTGGLDISAFVEPTIIEFPTFDKVNGKSRMIPAFYYKPKTKFKKPYPVVMYIHGGPESQFKPQFRTSISYWVNELGIAVIATNVRGSAGYGKDYLLLDNWEKREDSVKDIGAALDWIASNKELDKNRVAVYGGSYGGYMVLASMIKFSDRITCGVDIVGISSFVTFLKNTSDYRRDLRRAEYGDERKIGEFLNSISPLTHASKINKPLFVIQGKNDPRVPWTEAEQIVKIVRANNVEVWYQMAVNEGHGFRKKDNRDFMNYSVVKFWEKYLLNK